MGSSGTRRRLMLLSGAVAALSLILGLVVGAPSASASTQTFFVTSTACLGNGSITQAVADANAHPGADIISFTAGLVVDGGSCPDSTTQPGYAKWNYFMARVTESVTFEGNGARIQGQQYWLNPSGIKSMSSCPSTTYGTVMMASTPGFVLVGLAGGVDNAGINVEVRDLVMDQLNSIASVRKNAGLRISGSKMTNITRAIDCGGDGLIGVHEGSLDLIDSEISSSYNWTDGSILGAASIIDVEGQANVLRTKLLSNSYAYGLTVAGTANVVSSQFVSSGGLHAIATSTLNFVNSTMFFFGSPTALERVTNASASATTNIVASTISVPFGHCSATACRNTGYTAVPFTPLGGTINLRQSAVGVRASAPADSKVIETNGTSGAVTADPLTWIQPVDGQGAAALRTITGQAGLLTSAPGLVTNAFFAHYADAVTPLLGTPGTPGVLIDAVPDAGVGGLNELKSPIDGSTITTDVFGRPRVDGSGRRTIGAVQQSLAPHLTVTAVGDQAVSLGWSRPVDPPSPGLSGYGLKYRPVGSGSWSRADIAGAGTLTYQLTGLTNGTTYEFEVVGVSAGTDGPPSNIVPATPIGPITTPDLVAVPGDASAQVYWTAVECGGRSSLSYYEVVFRVRGAESWDLGPSRLTGRTATIPGLVNGETYEFGTIGVCSNGESSAMGTATASPFNPDQIDPDAVTPRYTG